MILDWLGAFPAFLAAVGIVFIPGLVALFGVGLRGLALVAAAPLFSVAATAVSALAFGQVGVPWSLLSWAIAMVVLVAITWVLGRVLGTAPAADAFSPRFVLVVGIALGALFAAWRLGTYIGDPEAVSQTNDAVFHMNAVRFILENDDASSLHVNAVIGGRSFYPAAWHGVVSLIVLATGVSIPVAANVFTLVIGALIWPAGIAWLARRVFGSNAVAAIAAVLAGALHAFPLLMFQWGVLFPNALSTALVPAGVAMVITASAWLHAAPRWRTWVRIGLLAALAAAALLLAQPAAFLPWAALSAVWITYRVGASAPVLGKAKAIVIIGASWLVLGAVWLFLARGTSGSHWPPFRGKLEVLLDVLLNGQVLMPFAFGVSILMLIGLAVAVIRPERRWFAVAWAGVSLLYVLVAGVGNPFVRESILGAWYADPYRIAALAPIVVIPLAASGLDAVLRLAADRLGTPVDGRAFAITGVAVASVIMVLIIALRSVAMPAFLQGTFDRESRYVAASDSYLDPDERTLLEELPEHVGPGERVLGNPSTGSGFGYFLSGLDVFPRTWAPPRSEAWAVLAADLRDAADDPDVCEALAVYGDPRFVLDFGPGEESPGRYPMPGMTGFEGQEGFTLVAEEGGASLWRITACGQ